MTKLTPAAVALPLFSASEVVRTTDAGDVAYWDDFHKTEGRQERLCKENSDDGLSPCLGPLR